MFSSLQALQVSSSETETSLPPVGSIPYPAPSYLTVEHTAIPLYSHCTATPYNFAATLTTFFPHCLSLTLSLYVSPSPSLSLAHRVDPELIALDANMEASRGDDIKTAAIAKQVLPSNPLITLFLLPSH